MRLAWFENHPTNFFSLSKSSFGKRFMKRVHHISRSSQPGGWEAARTDKTWRASRRVDDGGGARNVFKCCIFNKFIQI
jgi:hypothetical protein